jgi:act minimal PKS acyl carrier protein
MGTNMTFEDLRRILIECAGLPEEGELTERNRDTEFGDFGYDSLALLETAARIKQEFDVEIPDDEVANLRTPRAILDRVNTSINTAA